MFPGRYASSPPGTVMLHASGDLDAHWAFHENAEHVRNHLGLHAAAPPPTVMPLKVVGRAHLSLIR